MIKEAKFHLDNPKAKESTFIFLKFSCDDKVLPYSTKQKVLPADWDFVTQRSTDKKLNAELNKLWQIVQDYIEKCKVYQKPILRNGLREELDSRTNNKYSRGKKSIYPVFDQIIKDCISGKVLTIKGGVYAKGTIVNFQKTKNRLEEFDPNLQFENISMDTYNDLIVFCNKSNYSKNYTGNLIKEWKRMMAIAFSQKIHSNMIFNHPDFKIVSEEGDTVYLKDNEVQAIYELDLSWNKMRETIRDRFVINLYNGLRISDMKLLTAEMIHNGLITSINIKTGKKVVIPIHPIVTDIIKKYEGKMPHQYHEAVVNRYIKEIAMKAGLTERIKTSRTVGGKKKEFEFEKWELISCHTARRSLVTNLLKTAKVQDVRPVVGMSLKTLQRYDKRSAEENAEMLKENPFFKRVS